MMALLRQTRIVVKRIRPGVVEVILEDRRRGRVYRRIVGPLGDATPSGVEPMRIDVG